MHESGHAETLERGQHVLMDAVELVRAFGQSSGLQAVFQPEPLEIGGLVQRRGRIRVIFIELGRTVPVIGKIKASV